MSFPKGFLVNGLHCGIKKKSGKKDLSIFYSDKSCVASGMFTKNIFKAAPVIISQKNVKNKIRVIIANSGRANACTGKKGLKDAKKMCELTAKEFDLNPENILVASTGVIGQFLPIEKIRRGIKKLGQEIKKSKTCELSAVEGIMTTDTFPKYSSNNFKIGNSNINIWGCSKGSGMIEPNLATMLSFILTDAVITKKALNEALKVAVSESFNCLTVDGDTSTNDTAIVLANAEAGNKIISNGKDFQLFSKKLTEVCVNLTKMLAKDGEGATKLITINVKNAKSIEDSKKIAKTVANSPLVKTAVYGNDANWGRIVAAIGRSGVKFDSKKIDIFFGKVCVFRKGSPVSFSEKKAKNIISKKEIDINIVLNMGKKSSTVYTCDFTGDYVEVNASYRS
jgi:glutamate N-acetyltransferase / amino-acid N-acetyltransferase